MSNVTSITNEHKTAANIESFLIEGWGAEFEVAPAIVDLDVFEHIDKPYLTAAAGFLDFDNVFEIMKISGGEKVSIKVKSTHELAEEINKTLLTSARQSTELRTNILSSEAKINKNLALNAD